MTNTIEQKLSQLEEKVKGLPEYFQYLPELPLMTFCDPLTASEVLHLAYYLNTDGDHRKIAAALGVTPQNVRKTLISAMSRIGNISDDTATLNASAIYLNPETKTKLLDLLVAGKYFSYREVAK